MIAEMMKKMIEQAKGNTHDIHHFIKVWTYSKTIGELEKLDANTQLILEIAAITHDIACPKCREKYGNTNHSYQEKEGMVLVLKFLNEFDLTDEQKARVVYLVGHHHTLKDINGQDYQILIEADYIVNADEMNFSMENIKNFADKIFKTETGLSLLKTIYKL